MTATIKFYNPIMSNLRRLGALAIKLPEILSANPADCRHTF